MTAVAVRPRSALVVCTNPLGLHDKDFVAYAITDRIYDEPDDLLLARILRNQVELVHRTCRYCKELGAT